MQAVYPQFDIKAIQTSWKKLDAVAHLRPVRSNKEYDRMVKLMNFLLDAAGDNEEHALSGLLDLVSDLVSRYEQTHYAIDRAEPKDVLQSLINARGLIQDDLSEIVHQSNLSAILAGKRNISASMASKLGKFFGISPAVFVPK